MYVGKLALGLVLVIIAMWLFATTADPMSRYVASGILAVIGILLLIAGFRKKKF